MPPSGRFAALYLLGACATAGSPTTAFDADVKVAEWVELWRTYDLDRVGDLFIADSRLTYFSSEFEGLIVGVDAVVEHHRGFGFVEGGSPPANELWVEDVHSTAFGASSVVSGIWFFGDRDAPRDQVQRGPVTFVYVWDRGDYRLAHLHFGNYDTARPAPQRNGSKREQ